MITIVTSHNFSVNPHYGRFEIDIESANEIKVDVPRKPTNAECGTLACLSEAMRSYFDEMDDDERVTFLKQLFPTAFKDEYDVWDEEASDVKLERVKAALRPALETSHDAKEELLCYA